MKSRKKLKQRAIALVIVLSVIVILSAVIVAMAIAMRMERQAAHYFVERSSADLLARDGIECVKATIKAATSDSGRQWITMPGRIISATNSYASGVTVYDLHSGFANSTDTNSPNLDRLVRSDDSRTIITGTDAETQPLRVMWVYVRKDGTRDYSGAPDTTNTNNPIIGRFAYWADDESARIDLNTAWKRTGNTNSSINHPSKVDLLAVPGFTDTMADAVHNTATNTAFNSPDEAKRIASIAGIISSNRFSLSHYVFSSALNPWGNPKIYLTCKSNNLPAEILNRADYTNYYIRVMPDETRDPGTYATLSTNLVQAQLARISSLIKTNAWPYASGSLSQKYTDLNASQIALDTIEYARSAESTNKVVIPLRVNAAGGAYSFSTITGTDTNNLTGATRRPMLTELGVWCSDITNIGTNRFVNVAAKVEVCIPTRYGLPADVVIGKDITAQIYFQNPDDTNDTNKMTGPPTISIDATSTSTTVGDYTFVVASRQVNNVKVPATFLRRPTQAYSRLSLNLNDPADGGSGQFSSPFWDLAPNAAIPSTAPFPMAASVGISVTLDAVGVSLANIQSAQVSDPRINKYQTNWEQHANTFGDKNFNWQKNVGSTPPQDMDGGGSVSDVSMQMPYPKGSVQNPYGVVGSVAELGRIPTGTAINVPWRTLRFQPTAGTSLPDWVVLDLFTAPYYPTNNSALYTPRTNAVAGRINLNAGIWPFTNASRSLAMTALFQDTTNDPTFTSNKMATAVSNIINRTYATGGQNLGGTNGFLSVGEMAEIKGVADEGETSEHRLLGVVDLATVQGNVFRVYSLGQALTQTPSGKLAPQAEKLIIAIVERMSDGTLRTLYWRVVPI